MAQVYLAVLAPEAGAWTHALLAQKRVTNRFWRGALQTHPSAVNQAGQWALPGGEKKGSESAQEAARREFREETGYDLQIEYAQGTLADYPFSAAGGVIEGLDLLYVAVRLYLVVLRVSAEQQTRICTQANTGIAPKMGVERTLTYATTKPKQTVLFKPRVLRQAETKPSVPKQSELVRMVPTDRPSDPLIQDWELSSFEVVARQILGNRLGVPEQPVGLSPSDTQLIQQSSHDSQDISWYAAMATHLTTKVA